jgi:uncharacterized membrane protein YeaQ/YmgE (transglycosylase-associated protein family)
VIVSKIMTKQKTKLTKSSPTPTVLQVAACLGFFNLSLPILSYICGLAYGYGFPFLYSITQIIIQPLVGMTTLTYPIGSVLGIVGAVHGFRSYSVTKREKDRTLSIFCVISSIITSLITVYVAAFLTAFALYWQW